MPDVAGFKARIKELMRSAAPYDDGKRPTQSDLAQGIGLSRAELNKRLNQSLGRQLSTADVHGIVRILAEWGVLANQSQAEELLQLAGCPSFSEGEWASPPLDILSSAGRATTKGNFHRLAAALHPMPESMTTLGRSSELQELAARLANADPGSRSRLLVLLGMAGIGKTSLAALYCHSYASNYAHIIWRDLRLDPHLSGLVSAYASATRQFLDPASIKDETAQALLLLEWLHQSSDKALLVLDNFESILSVDGVPRNEAWTYLLEQPGFGAGQLLLTSRHHIWAGRKRLPAYQVNGMNTDDALLLLRTSGLVNEEANALSVAVAKAGGHPLALILLAQLVTLDHYSLKEALHSRLWDEELATRLLGEVYTRLGVAQQQLLRYLSIFDRPAQFRHRVGSADVAGMVSMLPPYLVEGVWGVDEVERVALSLSRRSLVEIADGHYTLHEIVRDYAYRQLPDAAPYHHAAADYFQSLYHHEPDTNPPHNLADVTPLLTAFDQLCAANDYSAAYRLMKETPVEYTPAGDATSLGPLLGRWSEYSQLQMMDERLLSAPANHLSERERNRVIGNLGLDYLNIGQYEQSVDCLLQALQFATASHDPDACSRQLCNLGLVYLHMKQYETSIRYSKQAIAASASLGDTYAMSVELHNLASAYNQLGDSQTAIVYSQQGLEIAKKRNDDFMRGSILSDLAVAYSLIGQYDKSVAYNLEGLQLAEKSRDRRVQARYWSELASIYQSQGLYLEALTCALQALPIYEYIRSPYAEEVRDKIKVLQQLIDPGLWSSLYAEARHLAAACWHPCSSALLT